MEPQVIPWVWAIPALPLAGFLINAFAGARWTKSPRPVVETGPSAVVSAPEAEELEYDMDKVAAAAGDHHTHAEPDGGDDSHGHGAHPMLDKGGQALVGGLATALVAAAFALSVVLFGMVQSAPDHRIFSTLLPWMNTPGAGGLPGLDLSFRLAVDPLSALMLLIITGVGTLIHLYSTGYMSHDKGYARYFAYLNLFVFFMLLLVMGSNFLVMFVGWEGVGLASYLLIGFWYERKTATDAGKKAFIVNRIGDAGLLLALFLIFHFFGTFEYFGPHGVLTDAGLARASAAGYSIAQGSAFLPYVATLVPLLLFFGATGKSAQIPLYVWLPDAMEGPTPVSALIHAATMVTAGVYLLCRTHVLFQLSPVAMTTVAVVGAATALLAASIALVQNDIKRVLAYSTVSQLGYMFLACGVGAYGAAMFHVTTHAFFKALLFLGAGSVIHAMSGEQDMRKMGGLAKKLPITFWTMLIGTLAIAGFPMLAGFFSKDEILMAAGATPAQGGLGSASLYGVGLFVAGLTAFYMMRLLMKTFFGTPRYDGETASHIHESPASMWVPLAVLAVLSAVGGYFKVPAYLAETVGEPRLHLENPLDNMIIAAAVAVIMIIATALIYNSRKNGQLLTDAQKARNPLWYFLTHLWFIDDLYDLVFVRDGKALANFCWKILDNRVVDGIVNGAGAVVRGAAEAFRGLQTGYVRNYALSMLVGVALVVLGCLIGLGSVLK